MYAGYGPDAGGYDRPADRWDNKMARMQEKMDRVRTKMDRCRGDWWGGGDRDRWGRSSTGNRAFDDYRTETLKRLEDEQREFKEFLERLRFAKDRAEFDQFMDERRNRPANLRRRKPRSLRNRRREPSPLTTAVISGPSTSRRGGRPVFFGRPGGRSKKIGRHKSRPRGTPLTPH